MPLVAGHLNMAPAAPWVTRFSALVEPGSTVLDLAAGSGRHARYFLDHGCKVTAIDRDVSRMEDLRTSAEIIQADLEDGSPFPLAGRQFDCIVVINYLHRPLLPALVGAVAPGGLFIYETYAKGHERFARPANPDFLLDDGELLRAVAGRLNVLAYGSGIIERPKPMVIQRIAAVNAPVNETKLPP